MAGFHNTARQAPTTCWPLWLAWCVAWSWLRELPAIAQSETLTLEEISQKLEDLEAYQKKMAAQLEERHKKIVADREARRKRLAEVEAKAKELGTWGKQALYEGTIPGFIYFPGTKTQFRLGGYARMDAVHNFNNMER